MFQRRQLQQLSCCITTNPRHSEFTHAVNTLTYITELPGSILVWDTNYVDIFLLYLRHSRQITALRLKSRPLPFPPVTKLNIPSVRAVSLQSADRVIIQATPKVRGLEL